MAWVADATSTAQTLLGSGLKAEQLLPGQAAARAALVYLATLAIVRLGKKRLMARATAFDVVVVIVIGSIAGRAITGNAKLGVALAGIAMVVAMHWLLSALAVRSRLVGRLAKEKSTLLIRDGVVDEAMLRHEHLTVADLAEDLRQKGHDDAATVREGRLERSGQLSAIGRAKEPRIIEIRVSDGVQTVRIELS
jgi:uncharacterized membrane protein YcaP (DUF421 family)